VLYSLRDPLIIDLLAITKQIFTNQLNDAINMLDSVRE